MQIQKICRTLVLSISAASVALIGVAPVYAQRENWENDPCASTQKRSARFDIFEGGFQTVLNGNPCMTTPPLSRRSRASE